MIKNLGPQIITLLNDIRIRRLIHAAMGIILLLALARHIRVTMLLQMGEIPGDFALIWIGGLNARLGISPYDWEMGAAAAEKYVGYLASAWYTTSTMSYIHAPTELLFTWPLTFLPWTTTALVWHILLQLTFFSIVGWLIWQIRQHGASIYAQWLFAILAILFIPAQFSIEVGQWDLPILALILAALALTQRQKSIAAGFAIGLAIAIKPTPVVLLGIFLVRKDWRAIISAASTVLALIGLSILLMGTQYWQEWLFQILPELLQGSTLANNQTYNGFAYRLFVDPALFWSHDPPPAIPAARWIAMTLSLSTLAGIMGIAWYTSRNIQPDTPEESHRLQLLFALFTIAMIVSSSIAWVYYYTWTLLPLALLLSPRAQITQGSRAWLWLALYLGAYALIVLPTRFYAFAPAQYETFWLLRLWIPTKIYGGLILAGLVIRALWLKQQSPTPGTHTINQSVISAQ